METQTINTHFQILESDENGEFNVIGSELKRSTTLPFSLKCWFEGMTGRNVKMIRWSDGETEATVIGRGGVLNNKAKC